MAWSDEGFVITSLNATSGPGSRVSGLTLVGAEAIKVAFKVAADGLHIQSMERPPGLKHVFVR
jgi:hypothetical protein